MDPIPAANRPRDTVVAAGYGGPMPSLARGRGAAARAAPTLSRALAAVAGALLVVGCGAAGSTPCQVDTDCAGGVCGVSGVCQPPPATDGGAGDGGPNATDGGAGDGGPNATDGGTATCVPNHDGTVSRDEVTLAPGLSATFRIATQATVDTAGTYDTDGTRHWHLDGPLAGDHDVQVATLSPAGTWWAGDFKDATYAGRLRDGQDLFGVFQATPTALMLLGVVSQNGGATRTELTYHPAVEVLHFPLTQGAAWRTDAQVTGVTDGVASYYTESWVDRVDAAGRLDTPYGTFDVLRVRVETTDDQVTPTRSFLFVSECFGTVASIFSNPGETAAEFTRAAEVERLAP